MARNAGISIENQFTKGLITEVSGVNSPENSVVDSLNVIYDRKGRALKRKGLDYELQHQFTTMRGSLGTAKAEFVWDTAQSVSFVVLQSGRYVEFFENSTGSSLSSNKKSFFIDLSVYGAGAPVGDIDTSVASFSSGKDYLFIAHPLCDPIYVKYNNSSDTITIQRVTIKIRDFEGVPDGLGIGQRPGSLSNAHMYNLMNQGWYVELDSATGPINSLGAGFYAGSWPSNSDIPWLWKRVAGDGTQEYSSAYRDAVAQGNSAAPKGHYILDAFYMQRNGLTGDGRYAMTTSGVPVTTSGQARPSCIAFFMGRVFYSGVDSEGYRSSIYFSQVIERDEQIGYCHQANDPTSEHAFDLLANDGGVIKILDIGRIVDIRNFGQTLFVFAENGVWAISGTQTSPFSATDYTVSKVSSFGLLNKLSVVELGETPVWWNSEGIYALGKDQTGFESSVTKLSEMTIQSFYDKIPISSRLSSKGVFNDQENLVYWLYSSVPKDDPYDYDSVLVFDVQTQAFYPFKLGVFAHQITGLIPLRGLELVSNNEDVISLTDGVVLTTLNEPVQITLSTSVSVSEKTFKFVTLQRGTMSLTFSEMNSESYYDFSSSGSPEIYQDFFITGYRIRGELMKKFQTNYLVVMTESVPTENESCYIQGIWDYRESSLTGKFTNPQQVYQYYQLTTYQRRKLRIRGNGYSLQFKFYGEAGKPYIIIGWAGFETSNTVP